jgi:pimeloyl-ACP methyl ester carboxylesterase
MQKIKLAVSTPGRSRARRRAAAVILAATLTAALLFPSGCDTSLEVPKGYSLTPEMKALLTKYPPPGKMVDIGGYKLHIDAQGKGGPTVVMEAGAGSLSLAWAQVAPEIAKTNHVITYDRAGLGWSDPSPKSRTADNIVAELHTLLAKSGEKPPYVLVGHSMGGVYMRMYAHKYPTEVKGIVLVDPGDENLPVAAGPAVAADIQAAAKQAAAAARQQGAKCATGQFADKLSLLPPDGQLPEKAARQLQALEATEPWLWSTIAAEATSALDSWSQARAANITSVGDIPLIVLVSDQTVDLALSMPLNQEANTAWRDLQAGLVSESPRGELQIAQNSGHMIQLDQPHKVIDAIEKVVRAAR